MGTTPKRYRACLIGLGRIADTIDDEQVGSGWLMPFSHMGSYSRVPEVEVVGAADLSAYQRETFGRRWNIPPEDLFEEFEEMLERRQPDIVSVCTSAAPRARIVLKIAEMVQAGKTRVRCLWVEKPIAMSLAEADAMVEACRKAGIILITNVNRASDVYYLRARQLIDAGELGTMQQVTAYGAGNLSHMGSHLLGTMCLLAGGSGRVKWVVGEVESDEKAWTDDDVRGNGYLAFENGVRGFFRMMPSGPAAWSFQAIGDKGMICIRESVGNPEFEFWRLGEVVPGAGPAPVRYAFPRPQEIWSPGVGQVKDAIACIETGKTPNSSGELGRHLLEIALAVRESHRNGNVRIDLPLKDRSLTIRSAETLHGDEPRALVNPNPRRRTGLLYEIARNEGVGERPQRSRH